MSNLSMRPGAPPGRTAKRGSFVRPLVVLLSLIALCGGYTVFAARSLQAAGQQKGRAPVAGTPESPNRIAPAALAQIEALLAEKKSRTAAQKKISSQLLYAAGMKSKKAVAGVTTLRTKVEENAAGQTRVDIRTTDTVATSAMVGKLGGRVEATYPKWNSVMAWMPLESLETLAAENAVRAISVPSGAILNRAAAPAEAPEVQPAGPPTAAEEKADRAERVRRNLTESLARFQDGVAGQRNDGKAARKGAASPDGRPETAPDYPTPIVTNRVGSGGKAGAPPVRFIGTRNSQGDATHGADQARGLYGVNGTGLKIGVLSDSFNNLGAAGTDVTNGDLPGPGNPNGFTTPVQFAGSGDLAGGGSDEGRAMLQIVHDLAPGAQLYFATAFNDIADFASNITALRAAGCDIIIDDVFYFVESGLHKGQSGTVVSPNNMAIVTQAVNDVTASGALYFSSAGNQGCLTQGTSATWEGDFVSGGNFTIPGDSAPSEVLDWDQTAGVAQSAQVLAGGGSPIVFQWANPLGAATDDYDIFLLNSTLTTVFDSSTGTQDGTQDPLEFIGGGAFTNERIVIVRFAGNPVFLSLTTNGDRIQFGTSGQIRGHSTAENGFGVAATPAATTFGAPTPNGPFPGVFVGTNQVENFSSDGPRRVFFNADGTAITPGNFLATGGQLLQKPDITAADGVDTTLPPGSGLNPFYGTSAAAPHAGAIAALVKSAAPGATPTQIRNFLQSTALDIMAGGIDRDAGFGILQARQAVAATGAAQVVNFARGTVTATEVGGNGNGGIDPGESATLTVQLTNIGGVAATGISAVLTSATPCVSVGTSASAYPDLAPTNSGVNTTPFTFTLSSGCACPLTVNFNLTVSFTGSSNSPIVIPVSVQTGPAPIVISSSLDATAPTVPAGFVGTTGTQVGRIFRDGIATTCAAPKIQSLFATDPGRRVDAYLFRTSSASPSYCVTVTLTNTGATDLQPAAYLGTFDGNNILANYAADAGDTAGPTSVGTTVSYSFTVPANQLVTLTVNDRNTGVSAAVPYSLSISGLCGVDNFAFLQRGAPMASEVAGPTNSDGDGNFEPCEEIQVNVPLNNIGSGPATGVNATLSTLTPAVTITQGTSSYGTIAAAGSQTNATPFRFRLAPCYAGSSVAFSLNVTYSGGLSPQTFTFNVGTSCALGTPTDLSFANPAAITIPSSGNGTPYPSTINVTGLGGTVTKVTATVTNMTHTWPNDVGVLLIGPGGQSLVLFNNAIGDGLSGPLTSRTYTFDQTAGSQLPTTGLPASGTFRPNNNGGTRTFQPGTGVPAPPYASDLSVFNGVAGSSLNGTWSLYVKDFVSGDSGSIAGGWSLTISTATADCSTTATCPVPQNLNSQIQLSVSTQAPVVATTPCAGLGYSNEITISGTLTNTSSSPVSCGYFEVIELRPANGSVPPVPFRLVTDPATCGGGGVGTRQFVPTLAPGQSVPISFTIAVTAIQRTRFFMNFFGFTNGVTVSRNMSAPPSGPEKGFEIAFDAKGKARIVDLTRTTPTNTAAVPRKSTGSK